MQIESLRIQNFRVFNNVLVENIPQMAVFVGQNGVGKSTFFDVFGLPAMFVRRWRPAVASKK